MDAKKTPIESLAPFARVPEPYAYPFESSIERIKSDNLVTCKARCPFDKDKEHSASKCYVGFANRVGELGHCFWLELCEGYLPFVAELRFKYLAFLIELSIGCWPGWSYHTTMHQIVVDPETSNDNERTHANWTYVSATRLASPVAGAPLKRLEANDWIYTSDRIAVTINRLHVPAWFRFDADFYQLCSVLHKFVPSLDDEPKRPVRDKRIERMMLPFFQAHPHHATTIQSMRASFYRAIAPATPMTRPYYELDRILPMPIVLGDVPGMREAVLATFGRIPSLAHCDSDDLCHRLFLGTRERTRRAECDVDPDESVHKTTRVCLFELDVVDAQESSGSIALDARQDTHMGLFAWTAGVLETEQAYQSIVALLCGHTYVGVLMSSYRPSDLLGVHDVRAAVEQVVDGAVGDIEELVAHVFASVESRLLHPVSLAVCMHTESDARVAIASKGDFYARLVSPTDSAIVLGGHCVTTESGQEDALRRLLFKPSTHKARWDRFVDDMRREGYVPISRHQLYIDYARHSKLKMADIAGDKWTIDSIHGSTRIAVAESNVPPSVALVSVNPSERVVLASSRIQGALHGASSSRDLIVETVHRIHGPDTLVRWMSRNIEPMACLVIRRL